MTAFLLDHILQEKKNWKTEPQLFAGEEFQECIILSFGKPRTAVFAHMDNIGFTVRYDNQLVRIGSPHAETGMKLMGSDSHGPVTCRMEITEDKALEYRADRPIDRGTDLSFVPDWREDADYVQCCYMDNRLGIWTALELCKTLENGVIVFSCWEEHGGGSVLFC